jgi:hypothetical protein
MHIPFEQTITGAYRFGFTKILSVIGVAWFPMLILAAIAGGVGYMFGPQLLDFFQHLPAAGDKPDPARAFEMFRLLGLFYLIFLPAFIVVTAMIRVGLMRKALGLIEGPVFVFFSLGAQVWRLIGAYILLMLALYALGIALAIGDVAVWGALHAAAPAAAAPVVTIVGIVAGCFVIYAFVRTFFFLPAVVVAEDLIGLGRSWELGGGNFWRIVGIVLIVYLPIGFAMSIVNSSIMQTIMPAIMQHAADAHTPAQSQAVVREMFGALARVLPYFGGLWLVQTVLTLGIDVGAVATAYRAVTGKEQA